jgi:DNA primase
MAKDGWYFYRQRLFFPVLTDCNYAWIAYNIGRVTKERPKTKNPAGPILSNMLFLYDECQKRDTPIILTEGIFDAIRLTLYGYNATCLFGTSISSIQIQLLNKLPAREVVVCLDADASGTSDDDVLSARADKIIAKLMAEYFYDVSAIRLHKGDPDDTPKGVFDSLYQQRERHRGLPSKVNKLKSMLANLEEE